MTVVPAVEMPTSQVRELVARADALGTVGRLAGAIDEDALRPELHVELVSLVVLRARAATERRDERRTFNDPTQRVEATTTPEGAKGWADQAGSAQVLAGGHGLDVAPDASPEGVRAETRQSEDRNEGEPSNALNAAGAPA